MDKQLRVLVSGGAAGIGAAIATRFRDDGAFVSVADVDAEAVAAARLRDPDLHAVVADVANPDDVDGWVDDVLDRWGGVDVLVNNAGVAGPTAYLEDIDPADWHHCIAVCLDSHFLVARRVIPAMKAQRSGSIVTISSTAGLFGYGMRTPYAAAKWAVIGLSKSLAVELGSFGIRVNVLAPGTVAGARMDHVIAAEAVARGIDPAEVRREYLDGQSLARFVHPSEIADVCAYLVSPGASMVSGQVVAVDGHTETFHLGGT